MIRKRETNYAILLIATDVDEEKSKKAKKQYRRLSDFIYENRYQILGLKFYVQREE